jgi:hypothetical protein
MYSLPSGSQIQNPSFQSLCASNYTMYYSNNYYCMPGPVSQSSISTGVLPGTVCPYIQYLNPMNLSQVTPSNGTATCGYASNGMAYCDSRMGDSQYTTLINNIAVGLQRTNISMCNPMSNPLQCVAFLRNVPSTFTGNYIKAPMIIVPGANALYSSNDECTRADLTSKYWST